MNLRNLRQILKTLSDDTRLRILNLLSHRALTVKDICFILGINQPNASKHLVRLRLQRLVNDKRNGNFIYYSPNLNTEDGKIMQFLISEFKDIDVFKADIEKLGKLGKKEDTSSTAEPKKQTDAAQEAKKE